MPASPLAAALLGGNEGNAAAFGFDPTALQANADYQLGQSLENQAISTAPAYPGQALARALMAIPGQAIQRNAISTLAKSMAGSAEEMQKIFPAGTKIGDALRSSNPMVRMTALQQAPKAMLLGTEPYNLEPAAQRMEGSNVVATSAQPQSPQGKAVRDAMVLDRAGQPGAAAAVTRPLVKEGSTPEGRPFPAVPLVPPRLPTSAEMAAGKAELAQRLNAARNAGVTSPSATGLQTPPPERPQPASMPEAIARDKANIAGAEQAAKNNADYGDALKPPPVAASAEPIKTPRGTLLPSTREQGPLPTSPKEFDQKSKAWQETQDGWNKGLIAGQQAEQRLNTIQGALKSFQSGAWTTERADWATKLKAAGFAGLADRVMANPAEAQKVLHEAQIETLQQLKSANPRFSQMEFKSIAALKENPNLQPEANLQLLAEDLGQIRHERALVNDWADAQKEGWRDPQAYERAWLQHNNLSTFVKQAKDEIGPLKGTGGQAAAPASGGGWSVRRVQPQAAQ